MKFVKLLSWILIELCWFLWYFNDQFINAFKFLLFEMVIKVTCMLEFDHESKSLGRLFSPYFEKDYQFHTYMDSNRRITWIVCAVLSQKIPVSTTASKFIDLYRYVFILLRITRFRFRAVVELLLCSYSVFIVRSFCSALIEPF